MKVINVFLADKVIQADLVSYFTTLPKGRGPVYSWSEVADPSNAAHNSIRTIHECLAWLKSERKSFIVARKLKRVCCMCLGVEAAAKSFKSCKWCFQPIANGFDFSVFSLMWLRALGNFWAGGKLLNENNFDADVGAQDQVVKKLKRQQCSHLSERQRICCNCFCTSAEIQCSEPVIPANGFLSTQSQAKYTLGSRIVFACNAGYTLQGSATATCQGDGQWSAAVPTCVGECVLFTKEALGVSSSHSFIYNVNRSIPAFFSNFGFGGR